MTRTRLIMTRVRLTAMTWVRLTAMTRVRLTATRVRL